MKFEAPLLVVENLDQSKRFYHDALDLEVILDFGANVTLTGGFSLQTKDTWMTFIHKQESEIVSGANATELYFEEDDFDGFIQKLDSIDGIDYVHPAVEHPWGQRAVRFYDVDKHIIEVGESVVMVVRRFIDSGPSIEETAIRMDVPVDYIKYCME
jgi:catechol 2,3-dioxygenase-like lactoylglutathione lyase family enzyme